MLELKEQVAIIYVNIDEKILRKQIEKTTEQQTLINDNLKNLTLN